ncbi:hypothetical protein SARC_03124 [Sphaeroforma arctica JP610]|uniref:PPM-type phosphatase domain-containing protein n=1 Tax=Sphaeroforma arctica JP610 TaxID=667725 RepID=A0A0L0G8V5_9EUKA|nr:hypothetical protein SARC_03124 [Sphaeroforma arctica JP610]KNC84663.1 hypothetical protein SARC_03124 [Sphaeroforma arctica JP610]|eukprot:XP_014158565.1 hypothetical protein SARC_03124 [Sphaeroforma arctica JP610]
MAQRTAVRVAHAVENCDDGHVEVSLIKEELGYVFDDVESEFVQWAESEEDTSGACALAVLLNDQDMFVANAGDCGGVLFTIKADKTVKTRSINHRHKCSNPSEERRILKAGGSVIMGRVNGVLEPTRAIGDIDMKGQERESGVIATAELHHIGLDAALPWILVMGTDGLFDFVTIKEIQAMIREPLRTPRDVQALATQLYESVIDADGDDDCTIIVVASNPTT